MLHSDPASGATTVLTRLEPGAIIPRHLHTRADETVYLVDGVLLEDGQSYGPGSFFAGLAGNIHGPHATVNGCTLLTRFSAPLDFVLAD